MLVKLEVELSTVFGSNLLRVTLLLVTTLHFYGTCNELDYEKSNKVPHRVTF